MWAEAMTILSCRSHLLSSGALTSQWTKANKYPCRVSACLFVSLYCFFRSKLEAAARGSIRPSVPSGRAPGGGHLPSAVRARALTGELSEGRRGWGIKHYQKADTSRLAAAASSHFCDNGHGTKMWKAGPSLSPNPEPPLAARQRGPGNKCTVPRSRPRVTEEHRAGGRATAREALLQSYSASRFRRAHVLRASSL